MGFVFAPSLGRHPSSISELYFWRSCKWPVGFGYRQFVRAPSLDAPPVCSPSSSAQVDNLELPALYFMPVYDYDEGRGLGVFANGYGELALCDFSGTPLQRLRRCFKTIALPPRVESWTPLPQDPVPCSIIRPHPCDDVSKLASYPEMLALWREHAPPHVPDGWTDNWELDRTDGVWKQFVHTTFTLAWRLEHVYGLHGPVFPLFRRDSMTFVKAAGELYLWEEEDQALYAVPPRTSYADVVHIAERPQPHVGLRRVEKNLTMEWYAEAVPAMWKYDEEKLKRDRAAELEARAAAHRHA
ncbi:hypothetical protein PsYK624_148670 [Phanerochaete sordida]|uniref:Uncharacterized protein n=1 Tax=Phanerochaete sordida TaxID=48140 RepID=A0A9P3GPC8_9APHY|nr:hypothetical protein PsYK624_148670 [Phanerochaete sordida]